MEKTKYGKSRNAIFTIDTRGSLLVTPTCIFYYPYSNVEETSIRYRYDVPDNTVKSHGFEYISRAEFYKILRDIEAAQEVKITVKMKW